MMVHPIYNYIWQWFTGNSGLGVSGDSVNIILSLPAGVTEYTITIDANTAATYTAIGTTSNTTDWDFEVNGITETFNFTVINGDTLKFTPTIVDVNLPTSISITGTV